MDYILKRNNRSASIRIAVNQNGEVVVSAPKFAPQFIIEQFIAKQQGWIERQKKRLELKQSAFPSFNWHEKIMSYLGLLYSIKVDTLSRGEKVELTKGICIVRPITGFEGDAKKTLLLWLKRQAQEFIRQRVTYWSTKMDVAYGEVRFGQQKSRWGSCSGKNNLRFNWRLIHFPIEVIDYVVIHELAHTVHHDHSLNFWKLVGRFCPEWKEQRHFLRFQVVLSETM